MSIGVLEARRFLVVEDDVVIAMLLEDYLSDMGCEMAWHAQTVDDALRMVETATDMDGAILDMNLNGAAVDPVAGLLASRRIPFCFMTGYGARATTGYPEAPIIGKPFDAESVSAAISRLKTQSA